MKIDTTLIIHKFMIYIITITPPNQSTSTNAVEAQHASNKISSVCVCVKGSKIDRLMLLEGKFLFS
jgi:hypothetical protein